MGLRCAGRAGFFAHLVRARKSWPNQRMRSGKPYFKHKNDSLKQEPRLGGE